MLEEKSKVLRWVVDKVPDLQDIEDCRAVVVKLENQAVIYRFR